MIFLYPLALGGSSSSNNNSTVFNSHHWQRLKPVEMASKVFCGQTLLGRIGAGLYFPKSYIKSIKLGHMKPTYKLVHQKKKEGTSEKAIPHKL